MAGRRPKNDRMDERAQHSHDNRKNTGRFDSIFNDPEIQRWTVKDGKHEFCIIPYNAVGTENSPFRALNPEFNAPFTEEEIKDGECWDYKLTLLMHTNIGSNQDMVVCLKTFKQACPICEKRSKIYDLMDQETDKEEAAKLDKKQRALSPSKKAVYNVVVFDTEKDLEKGVQIWEAPAPSIEDKLTQLRVDERTGEKRLYMNPEEGWNVYFNRYKEQGDRFAKYHTVNIVGRKKEQELSSDDFDALYEMAYPLDNVVDIKTYDELKEMIAGFDTEDGSENKDEPVEEKKIHEASAEKPGRFRGSRFAKNDEVKEEPAKEEETVPEEEPPFEADDLVIPDEHVEAEKSEDEFKIPDCYGKECNKLSACETCPETAFNECYNIFEEAKKKAAEKPKVRKPLRGKK